MGGLVVNSLVRVISMILVLFTLYDAWAVWLFHRNNPEIDSAAQLDRFRTLARRAIHSRVRNALLFAVGVVALAVLGNWDPSAVDGPGQAVGLLGLLTASYLLPMIPGIIVSEVVRRTGGAESLQAEREQVANAWRTSLSAGSVPAGGLALLNDADGALSRPQGTTPASSGEAETTPRQSTHLLWLVAWLLFFIPSLLAQVFFSSQIGDYFLLSLGGH